MNTYQTVKFPLSTEKAVRVMQAENKLIFVVDKKANKIEIRKAVEEIFKVKVVKINTLIDRDGNKRAYVKFSADHPAIDITTKLGLM
ncbi:50S ribosomal protein L23 [Candidatus Woesearchaeota archaeon CG11_big_fil_rev_8_21_14_0_20_43_8]|nr:MAG: 50S ribosomal protein L23 [Candidatus Woesearchaeota archaeon CG11_big_fil_rev_8_21_14_0_20_43_8]PIO05278.1 MAG: 50S ribosomal protein L23 [Candidatus Woesearchaeota archaeon CG08_land_8_20_14_0_20_43_7]